ncbi:MAG: DsbA family protein [Anaerolineales bacterium]
MPVMPPRKKQPIEPIIEQDANRAEPVTEPEDIPESTPAPGQDDTVTFKRSHFYSVLTVLAFATGVLLGYVVWGVDAPAGAATAQAANQPSGPIVEAPVTPQAEFKRYDIPTEDSYAIGPADAPITIVEFSDYQCPYCRRWHEDVYEPLLAAYPGKVRLVYRHFPLSSIHPDATSAAEAAMCAGEQDAFWPFHEKLFSSDALGNTTYVQYAQELGLNMNNFESCMNDRKYQQAVDDDLNFAVNLGIRSTPTFFINGIAVVGAQPLDVFKEVITKELNGEIPK